MAKKTKKTKKVKKKAVKLKKIKVATVKKKKKVKKKTTKKKSKVRKKRKIGMEDLYKILNKVQIKKKPYTFAVNFNEVDIVENIVKDVQLKYHKTEMKTQVLFKLYPPAEQNEFEILEIEEYLDDEIIEDGQIFP